MLPIYQRSYFLCMFCLKPLYHIVILVNTWLISGVAFKRRFIIELYIVEGPFYQWHLYATAHHALYSFTQWINKEWQCILSIIRIVVTWAISLIHQCQYFVYLFHISMKRLGKKYTILEPYIDPCVIFVIFDIRNIRDIRE